MARLREGSGSWILNGGLIWLRGGTDHGLGEIELIWLEHDIGTDGIRDEAAGDFPAVADFVIDHSLKAGEGIGGEELVLHLAVRFWLGSGMLGVSVLPFFSGRFESGESGAIGLHQHHAIFRDAGVIVRCATLRVNRHSSERAVARFVAHKMEVPVHLDRFGIGFSARASL